MSWYLSFGRYITNSYGFSYAVFYYMVELVGGVRFHIVHTYTKKKKTSENKHVGVNWLFEEFFFWSSLNYHYTLDMSVDSFMSSY